MSAVAAQGIEALIEVVIHYFGRKKAVREKVVPLLDQAGQMQGMTNEQRREWAVKKLMDDGYTESTSRFMVETGLKYWKKLQAKQAKRQEKEARRHKRALN